MRISDWSSDVCSSDLTLVASKRAARQPATNLALHTGSKLTVEEAINALIIRSANDVAVVVAETLGGTESEFAQMMTKRAHQLGMSSEEHTSELQSLMRISYAVFCLKKKNENTNT